jgi:hypothetical protein
MVTPLEMGMNTTEMETVEERAMDKYHFDRIRIDHV